MEGCSYCDGSGWIDGHGCPSCNHEHLGVATVTWNGKEIPNGWEKVEEKK